jgi:predicted DNA-binding transcriptional regulator AlpA
MNKRFLTERQVAELTSITVSKLRADRHLCQGLPYVKIGRSVKYDLHDVYTYMEARKIQHEGVK